MFLSPDHRSRVNAPDLLHRYLIDRFSKLVRLLLPSFTAFTEIRLNVKARLFDPADYPGLFRLATPLRALQPSGSMHPTRFPPGGLPSRTTRFPFTPSTAFLLRLTVQIIVPGSLCFAELAVPFRRHVAFPSRQFLQVPDSLVVCPYRNMLERVVVNPFGLTTYLLPRCVSHASPWAQQAFTG
jgi:hypothetical protein